MFNICISKRVSAVLSASARELSSTNIFYFKRLFATNVMAEVKSINVTVDEKNIQNGAMEILRVVRPQWTKPQKSIISKVFTDGLSNKLVGFFIEDNPEDTVIVKVFGTNTGMMIDRKAEIETMRVLHERKCGAQLYATFENGICYEYMNGCTLEVRDCQDLQIYPLVAAEMAHMHSGASPEHSTNQHKLNGNHIEINHNNNHEKVSKRVQSKLWDKIWTFNSLAEESLESDAQLKESLALLGVTAGWAKGAITTLENILEAEGMPVTFCHNDLISRNIIYDEKRKRVTFIDVEYAMDNYPAFDVANHFLEFAGVPELDYSKCPDKEFRLKWIKEYLKNLKLDNYEDITVEKFNEWVELCFPASHLFWGLWGIYQARHSTIDFDYIKYVGVRFTEYRKCMESQAIQQRMLKNHSH